MDFGPQIQAIMQQRQNRYNNISNISQAITGLVNRKRQERQETDAISFFQKENISPEKINEFKQLNPSMSIMDIYKAASAVAEQKQAFNNQKVIQETRNLGKSMWGLAAQGGDLSFQGIAKFMEGQEASLEAKQMFAIKMLPQFLEFAKKKGITLGKNQKYLEKGAGGKFEEVASNKVEDIKTPKQWDIYFKENKGKINPDTEEIYTSAELIKGFQELKPTGSTRKEDQWDYFAAGKTGEINPDTNLPYTKDEIATDYEKIQTFAPDIKLRYNPNTKKMIQVNERDPEVVQKSIDAGFKPLSPELESYLSKKGGYGADAIKEIAESSVKGRSEIVTLDFMGKLLDRFKSGMFTGMVKDIQRFGAALNLPIDYKNLAAKEAFQATAKQLALQSRNLGPGMVLAGQMSDKDVKFLEEMNVQLLTSEPGNRLIIDIRTALAKRKAEVIKLAKQYEQEHGGIFDQAGFEVFMTDYSENNSIFGVPAGAEIVGTDQETGLPVYSINGDYFVPEF